MFFLIRYVYLNLSYCSFVNCFSPNLLLYPTFIYIKELL
nr:MAG TPA: hypothetical protein [Caudoviricetes sp.]